MKNLFKLFAVIFLFSATTCHAQRMVQTVDDAKRLEINKERYIGKSFSVLLTQISPEIKFAYGIPDNTGESITGTSITFFFIDKNEYKRKNVKPTGVSVTFRFEANNTRMPIPIGGIDITKEELLKEYGDMVVLRIYKR